MPTVLQLRAESHVYYLAATFIQRQALAAFNDRDYRRWERLTEEAREMRRDGDGALEAELRVSVASLEKRA